MSGKSNIKNKKYNKYDLDSKNYGIGYTSNGDSFLFDKTDYDLIKGYCWWINDSGYVIANIPCQENKKIRMHRLIMNADDNNVFIDHKNHNKTDNRKENLRKASVSQNTMNGKIRNTNTSGVVGVVLKRGRWVANITVNNQTIYLGSFDNFNDAVAARKQAEEKYFGEFSYDNSREIC